MKSDRNSVLVIAAHPDDEVLGAGGTVAWFSHIMKVDVNVLILTEGCSSQYKGDAEVLRKKKEEAEKANEILGVKDILFVDLPDMRLDSLLHVEINKAIGEAIERFSPDVVFTQHPDVNKDHVLVYESTMVATRPAPGQKIRRVYTYPSSSSTEWSSSLSSDYFVPNTFFDISETLDYKLQAFSCYKTEIREYPHPRALKSIRIYAERDGITIGRMAAEPFALVRSIEN